MKKYRIEIGFDRKGLPNLGGNIYLPSGVARIHGEGQPETLWKYRFEPGDRVAFRVFDITSIFDGLPLPGAVYNPGSPRPLLLSAEFQRARAQVRNSPILSGKLVFPTLQNVGGGAGVFSVFFGKALPGWDALTGTSEENQQWFEIVHPGGFEASYQLTLSSGEQYAQDPEWVVGGGEEPPDKPSV